MTSLKEFTKYILDENPIREAGLNDLALLKKLYDRRQKIAQGECLKDFKYFASFGGNNLEGFRVHPLKVVLLATDLQKIKNILLREPFNGRYCAIYDIKDLKEDIKRWRVTPFVLDELLPLRERK